MGFPNGPRQQCQADFKPQAMRRQMTGLFNDLKSSTKTGASIFLKRTLLMYVSLYGSPAPFIREDIADIVLGS